MGRYLEVVGEAASQLLQAICSGHDANMTFSARCGRIKHGIEPMRKWWFIWYSGIVVLDTFWPGHMEIAMGPDEANEG